MDRWVLFSGLLLIMLSSMGLFIVVPARLFFLKMKKIFPEGKIGWNLGLRIPFGSFNVELFYWPKNKNMPPKITLQIDFPKVDGLKGSVDMHGAFWTRLSHSSDDFRAMDDQKILSKVKVKSSSPEFQAFIQDPAFVEGLRHIAAVGLSELYFKPKKFFLRSFVRHKEERAVVEFMVGALQIFEGYARRVQPNAASWRSAGLSLDGRPGEAFPLVSEPYRALVRELRGGITAGLSERDRGCWSREASSESDGPRYGSPDDGGLDRSFGTEAGEGFPPTDAEESLEAHLERLRRDLR